MQRPQSKYHSVSTGGLQGGGEEERGSLNTAKLIKKKIEGDQ